MVVADLLVVEFEQVENQAFLIGAKSWARAWAVWAEEVWAGDGRGFSVATTRLLRWKLERFP